MPIKRNRKPVKRKKPAKKRPVRKQKGKGIYSAAKKHKKKIAAGIILGLAGLTHLTSQPLRVDPIVGNEPWWTTNVY